MRPTNATFLLHSTSTSPKGRSNHPSLLLALNTRLSNTMARTRSASKQQTPASAKEKPKHERKDDAKDLLAVLMSLCTTLSGPPYVASFL